MLSVNGQDYLLVPVERRETSPLLSPSRARRPSTACQLAYCALYSLVSGVVIIAANAPALSSGGQQNAEHVTAIVIGAGIMSIPLCCVAVCCAAVGHKVLFNKNKPQTELQSPTEPFNQRDEIV